MRPGIHEQQPEARVKLASPAQVQALAGGGGGGGGGGYWPDVLDQLGSQALFVRSPGTGSPDAPIARIRLSRPFPLTIYSDPGIPLRVSDPAGTADPANYQPIGTGARVILNVTWGVGRATFTKRFPPRRPIQLVAEYVNIYGEIWDPPFIASDLGGGYSPIPRDRQFAAYWSCGIGLGQATVDPQPTNIESFPTLRQGGWYQGAIASNAGTTLYSFFGFNYGAAGTLTYLQLFDDFSLADVTGNSIPLIEIPVQGQQSFSLDFGNRGCDFSSGINWQCSSTKGLLTLDVTQRVLVTGETGAF